MSLRPSTMVLATLLAALLLAACGSDDEPAPDTAPSEAVETATAGSGHAEQRPAPGDGGLTDEEQIEASLEALLASSKAADACEGVVTDAFVKRAYGDRAGCAAALDPAAAARSVTVGSLEIEGETAVATVEPKGGVYDGETLDVELVREGVTWKVDRLEADIPVGP